jgi:type IV pilus assembly protein PilY1
VRIATTAATTSQDPNGRGWLERWVVLLNGGYDPGMVRGRGVWMLDVWTGQTLWRYRNDEFQAMRGETTSFMGPIAATPALVDMGAGDRITGSADVDGYFDTATFGDVLGNLYVARFYQPGTFSATTGLINNWSAARTFEMNRKSSGPQDMRARGQFFFMTTDVLDPPSKLMVMAGSGNREQLMEVKPTCSADDLLGCCQAGCSVTSAAVTASYGTSSCSTGGTFSCSAGALTWTPSGGGAACNGSFACGASSSSVTQSVTFNFDCGTAGKLGPFSATLTCDSSGICSTDTVPNTGTIDVSSITTACSTTGGKHDCMFGVWGYGQKAEKRFDETDSTGASAKAFDENRFTDVAGYSGCGTFGTCSLVNASPAVVIDSPTTGLGVTCQGLPSTAKCQAGSTDPGWKYCYGEYCATGSCTTPDTTPPWCDERTASAAVGGYSACVQFATFRPTGAVSLDPCSAASGTPTTLSYLVDPLSGTPSDACGYGVANADGTTTYNRAQSKNAYSPPKTSTVRIVVNDKGEVNYSVLGDPSDSGGEGADKNNLMTRSSTAEPLYILEVPRVGHQCRHVANSGKCE